MEEKDNDPQKSGQGPVTEAWTVGDVLRRYPVALEVMAAFGLSCTGCGARFHETLAEGMAAHGEGRERVQALVKAINERIASNPVSSCSLLSVTRRAAEKIRELAKKEGRAGWGVRLAVHPGGCSGFSYAMDFQKKEHEGDAVAEVEGVRFFIDQESLPMLKGVLIDYVDTLQGSGFKISNPNASATCGCGQSFH